MKVVIPRLFAIPIAISSVHGLTDFDKGVVNLLPYLLMSIPVKKNKLYAIFLLSSLQHFSYDIGYAKSILLHSFWLCGFKYYANIAWMTFCIFYSCFHVPLTFYRRKFNILYIPISLLFLKLVKKEGMYIDDKMLKLVICHVLCNLS